MQGGSAKKVHLHGDLSGSSSQGRDFLGRGSHGYRRKLVQTILLIQMLGLWGLRPLVVKDWAM